MVQESEPMLDRSLSQLSGESGGRLLQSAILQPHNLFYHIGCRIFANLLAIQHLTNHGYSVARKPFPRQGSSRGERKAENVFRN